MKIALILAGFFLLLLLLEALFPLHHRIWYKMTHIQKTDFSVVLFRPNFLLVSEEHPALHQKCSLTTLFVCKMELFGLEKSFK
jgi:hypothetical protein